MHTRASQLNVSDFPQKYRLGFWAERNGCVTPYAQEDTFDDDVHHMIWTCQGQYGALQHYKTDDQSSSNLIGNSLPGTF